MIARLRTADVRFSDAQTERTWAIVSAHQAGLSIRRIAGATGLSSSRIHQLLNAPEAKEIPVWQSQLRQSSGGYAPKKEAERPKPETKIGSRLSREVEALLASTGRGWSACWNELPLTWITAAWCRMAFRGQNAGSRKILKSDG
jgi:hypothetical protein